MAINGNAGKKYLISKAMRYVYRPVNANKTHGNINFGFLIIPIGARTKNGMKNQPK